jgi:hypothetical protein
VGLAVDILALVAVVLRLLLATGCVVDGRAPDASAGLFLGHGGVIERKGSARV